MGFFRRKLADDSAGTDHLFGHVYGGDGKQTRRQVGGRGEADPERNHLGQAVQVNVIPQIASILKGLDLTEAFKTKGDLKRWSAKRTVGGVIALTACNDIMANGITWPSVVLCAVAITPLCLSFTKGQDGE